MNIQILTMIGGLMPILYILYAIVQSVRQRPIVNGFGMLLAYAAVLIPIGAFAWGSAQNVLPPLFMLATVASAAITFLFGVVLLIRNIRSPQHAVSRSYGLLSVGASLLIALGLVVTPTILTLIAARTASAASEAGIAALPFANQELAGTTDQTGDTTFPAAPEGFELPAGLEPPAGFSAASASTDDETANTEPNATPTPTATLPNLRQAVLPTITPTLAFTATPTPTTTTANAVGSTQDAASMVQATCDLLVLYNLNLRAEPSADAQLILTIPYSTRITADASRDGWWHVEYNGQTGWVSGEFVSAPSTCDSLTDES